MPIIHWDGGTLATYAAMMRALDVNVGKVLAALDRLGLADNTIVVFTSDNGGERFSDMWPFTGRKTELLEGGIRIPAIVRWPGLSKAGSTSDAQIMTMDWLPTFLAAAGGAPDPRFPTDGVDLRTFIFPGVLCMGALFTGIFSAASLVWDRELGFLREMLVAPVRYMKSRSMPIPTPPIGGIPYSIARR